MKKTTITVNLTEINLPDGFIHESTIVTLSKDRLFTDIAETKTLTESLLLANFVGDFDPEKELYVKARMIYNKGFSNDTDVYVFKPLANTDISLSKLIPTVTKDPVITVPDGDNKNYPISEKFKVDVVFAKSIDTVDHKSTSYILEDGITGEHIESLLDNEESKTSHTFQHLLKRDKLYRIKVSVKATNDVVSSLVAKTILTED